MWLILNFRVAAFIKALQNAVLKDMVGQRKDIVNLKDTKIYSQYIHSTPGLNDLCAFLQFLESFSAGQSHTFKVQAFSETTALNRNLMFTRSRVWTMLQASLSSQPLRDAKLNVKWTKEIMFWMNKHFFMNRFGIFFAKNR